MRSNSAGLSAAIVTIAALKEAASKSSSVAAKFVQKLIKLGPNKDGDGDGNIFLGLDVESEHPHGVSGLADEADP